MSRFDVEIDTSEIDRELRRLQRGPEFDDLLAFDRVLYKQFAQIRVDVHVITGSLYLSGKVDSSITHAKWEGEITFGGASPGGVHDPVDYALYEQERDGLHDFMQSAYGGDPGYVEAIIDYYRGGL